MDHPKSIEAATAYIAVGSLHVLGIFFVLDGQFGFLAFIEEYAKTTAWGILVSVPLITISYLLGVLSGSVADIAFDRLSRCGKQEVVIFHIVSSSNSSLIEGKWRDWDLKMTLLKASAIACPTLACGCLMERRLMGDFANVGVIGAIGAVAFAVILVFLALDHSKRGIVFFSAIAGAKEPNKAPEPTPGAVTPRATEGTSE